MPNSNGFSAWIVVHGVELPEYEVKYSPDARQATCWIPSEADKCFTVCWRDPIGLVGTAGYLTVDGTPCGAKHMYSSAQRPKGRIDVVEKSSVSTTPTTERPLSFARLELTDDDLYLNIPASPHLGDIRLDIFEVSTDGMMTFAQPGMLPDTQILHERTKKVVGHRVKLGHETHCREKKFAKIKKICHLCTFVFRYRPIELLKANGIVPSDNDFKRKRSQALQKNEIIDLTAEDYDRNERKQVKTEIKMEIETQPIKTEAIKTEIKAEAKLESMPESPIPPFRSYNSKEVIDLTLYKEN